MQRIEGMKSRGEGGEGRGECVVTMQWATVEYRIEVRGECVDGALERALRGIRRTVRKSRE